MEALPITIGSLMLWSVAGTDPAGGFWMIADGRAISRADYPAYFALAGTTFGPGDGSTTFNIPNIAKQLIGGNVALPFVVMVRNPAGEAAVSA